MQKVTFNLTIEEANLIFQSLGKLPFEQVFELIGKLNDQANQQLNANSESTERKFNLTDFLDEK